MSATLKLDGFNDLKRALMSLPEDLRDASRQAVTDAALRTAAQVRMKYASVRTGDGESLADHVAVVVKSDAGHIKARVTNSLPYAASFEFGTQIRKRKGKRGSTGAAPASPTLMPAARREKAAMVDDLIAIVRGFGFEVRGA